MIWPHRALRLALPMFAALALPACGYDRGSRSYDVSRYDLDAHYDWQRGRLVARVDITLAPTEDGIEDIELDSAVDVRAVRIREVGDVDYEVQPEKRLWVSLEDVDAKIGSSIVVTVEYEAAPSDALRPVGERAGDPLSVRALFTDSEPEGARWWMPSHDEPSDRAFFSAGLRMDPSETAISNGVLKVDRPEGSSRYMRYETAYPLPPYLMAFAISEFEVVQSNEGRVPVEVWHRKGLQGDHQGTIVEISRMMAELEAKLGPYPFERYALVLVPGHMYGGMENAGITFQRETASTALGLSGDLRLAAHELAHQWFGDLVTVKTWDDVWIKEGLATLFEAELVRSHVDASGAGTLNANAFRVVEGEAIRDPSKAPNEKYDSGPYSRSAWFFTQIRKAMGDDAFFEALKGLIDAHRMGALSVTDIVQTFGPVFGPEGEAMLGQALTAKALPSFVWNNDGEVVLFDPDHALLVPFEVDWIAGNGAWHRKTIEVGVPFSASVTWNEILVSDPSDVHPPLVRLSTTPSTLATLSRFQELPGAIQAEVLESTDGALLPLEPSTLAGFLKGLHSDAAQALALEAACTIATSATPEGAVDPQWVDAIQAAFMTMPTPFGLSAVSSYSSCSLVLDPKKVWPDEWASLASGLPNDELSIERLVFLSKFDRDYADVWPAVINNGGSLRTKMVASGRMQPVIANHEMLVDWVIHTEAAELLQTSLLPRLGTTSRRWKTQWEQGDPAGEAAFSRGLQALGVVLKRDATRPAHRYALCTVRNLLQSYVEKPLPDCRVNPCGTIEELVFDFERWDAFVAGLDGAPLSEQAAEVAKDPSLCD